MNLDNTTTDTILCASLSMLWMQMVQSISFHITNHLHSHCMVVAVERDQARNLFLYQIKWRKNFRIIFDSKKKSFYIVYSTFLLRPYQWQRTQSEDKKEEIWHSPMTSAPTTTEMSKGQSYNTNNVTKEFDYKAIADRFMTVSWSNYSYPTGVVNRFTDPPSHSPQQPCNEKVTHLKICK